DYVIYLEINSLGLYEPGSSNQLYRGRADITVSLVNMKEANETPLRRNFSCSYPSELRGGIREVDSDRPPQVFKTEFLDYMSRRLAWYFTSHPTNTDYQFK